MAIILDGSQLTGPIDQFSIDWAELTIEGVTADAAVPEPASITLLAVGLIGMARMARRTHR